MPQLLREKIQFTNDNGEQLAALLEHPADTARAYALFAHCFTCSKNISAASRISNALATRGIGVLRFDFTGLGNSDGDFANTNFSSNIADLLQAAKHLKHIQQAPKILIGHSLGGAAVLAAAQHLPAVKAVITIGAPSDPAHVSHLFDHARQTIAEHGQAEVNLAGRHFTIKQQFLDDISKQNLQHDIKTLKRALLIFHSPLDDIVAIEHARHIYEAAKHPKSFISLDDADHLLNRASDAEYVAETLAVWASRYIGIEQAEATPSRPAVAAGEILVSERGPRYSHDVFSAKHYWRADEPETQGGLDTGPTPFELLLSALGACTAMTLRMYADFKQFSVGKISVRLKHCKLEAKDCDECESTEGKVDIIEREIHFEGELDPALEPRLVRIADKCPVHQSLMTETVVKTHITKTKAE